MSKKSTERKAMEFVADAASGKPMKSRAARIKERIAETTAAAKDKFVPVEHGPDPRMHRHEIPHAVHQQKEAAAGSFEDAFDYENPDSDRFLPEGMDGVIQIKTASEVAGDEAYEKVLKDPTSVLAPRRYYNPGSADGYTEDGPIETGRRSIVDAGHELAKQQVSAAHRKDWLEGVRAGIGVADDGSDPTVEEFYCPEVVDALATGDGVACGRLVNEDGKRCFEHSHVKVPDLDREVTRPHRASVGCSGCGGVTHEGSTIIGRDGDVYCFECRDKGLADVRS